MRQSFFGESSPTLNPVPGVPRFNSSQNLRKSRQGAVHPLIVANSYITNRRKPAFKRIPLAYPTQTLLYP